MIMMKTPWDYRKQRSWQQRSWKMSRKKCQGKLSSPQDHQNSSYSWRFPVFNLGMPLDMSVSSNQWQMKIYRDFQSWKQNMISLMTSLAISASWSIRKKGSLPLFFVAVFCYSIPFSYPSQVMWVWNPWQLGLDDSKVSPGKFPRYQWGQIHGCPYKWPKIELDDWGENTWLTGAT